MYGWGIYGGYKEKSVRIGSVKYVWDDEVFWEYKRNIQKKKEKFDEKQKIRHG